MNIHRPTQKVSSGSTIGLFENREFPSVIEFYKAKRAQGEADPVLALLTGQSLVEIGRGNESGAYFTEAVSLDSSRALTYAIKMYLNRRQRTTEGWQHEDGWIRMLDILLETDLINTFETREELFEDFGRRSKTNTIPKRIVQFWDKPTPPQEVVICVNTVRETNIDYAHQLFCEEEARHLVVQVIGSSASILFDACPHPAAKSDFFRAAYLYDRGGIYVDADECMQSKINDHLDIDVYDLVISYTRSDPTCINNWFVASAPKQPVVARALEHVVTNLENFVKDPSYTNVWVMTGPGAWSFAVADVAIDPLENHPRSALSQSCFLAEPVYRQMFSNPPMQYKNTPEGNWRLL